MQTANIVLLISAKGDTVAKRDVTPAEALLLKSIHTFHGKGNPIKSLVIDKDEVKRTSADEFARLLRKYKDEFVKSCFPGAAPQLPVKFEDAFPTAKPLPATGGAKT